jgi:hypothetical protein
MSAMASRSSAPMAWPPLPEPPGSGPDHGSPSRNILHPMTWSPWALAQFRGATGKSSGYIAVTAPMAEATAKTCNSRQRRPWKNPLISPCPARRSRDHEEYPNVWVPSSRPFPA